MDQPHPPTYSSPSSSSNLGNADAVIFRPLDRLRRAALITLGTLALGLGILGAITPGLPSTVFLLIATACYARSSERLFRWMMTRPWLQGALKDMRIYHETRALPLRVKIVAQTAAWSSFALMYWLPTRAPWFVKWIVLAAAIACSAFMLTRKTART